MTSHITSFKVYQSISDWSLHICYSVHAQTAKHVVMLPPYFPVKTYVIFYKNRQLEEEIGQQDTVQQRNGKQ